MKIISKHKDYYDKCVTFFGRDETRVYDRRISHSLIPKKLQGTGIPLLKIPEKGPWAPRPEDVPYDHLTFHICGKKRIVLHKGGKFFFTEAEMPEKKKKNPFWWAAPFTENSMPTELNALYRQPVLMGSPQRSLWIPTLADYGFPARIPAEEIYQKIYDFLGWLKDNPPIPNTQKDIEKVVAHGFDKKASFRPKIKRK